MNGLGRQDANLVTGVPRFVSLLTVLIFTVLGAKSVNAGCLFFDNFNGPDLRSVWQPSLPDAPWRFPQETEDADYLGAPEYSFQMLDDVSVIRLTNTLNDAQRVGWSSSRVFDPRRFPSTTRFGYAARFDTLDVSPGTSIDQLLELWLVDAEDDTKYDKVELTAPGYGSEHLFNASSSISDVGFDTGLENPTGFTFKSNTWYRMVSTGSWSEPVHAAVLDHNNKLLISVSLKHTLSSYPSGFRIGISQSMGLPGAPYPTDVAINYVVVTAIPATKKSLQ